MDEPLKQSFATGLARLEQACKRLHGDIHERRLIAIFQRALRLHVLEEINLTDPDTTDHYFENVIRAVEYDFDQDRVLDDHPDPRVAPNAHLTKKTLRPMSRIKGVGEVAAIRPSEVAYT